MAHKMARKLPQVITKEEFNALLEQAKKDRDTYKKKSGKLTPQGKRINQYIIAMILGCHAGMRISEIVGLKDKIEPLTQDRVQKDRIFVSQGKGKKDRWVWRPKLINNKAVQELPLKVSRRSIQRYVSHLAARVLGKDIHFHTLRHTFGTEFLKKNPQDIRTLQVLMGHSRMDTTAIYTHVSPDEALKKVEDVF